MFLTRLFSVLVVVSFLFSTVLADYTVTQRRTVDDSSIEMTVQAKGVRVRRSQKMVLDDVDDDPMTRQMMESMMPSLTYVSQCDLKQDLEINDKTKSYFIEYHDWTSVPPEKLARRPKQKLVVKGTMTMSSVVTDSGKRKEMFGMTARWQKHVQDIEFSADSCEGPSKNRIESEGWYVDISLESKGCYAPPPPTGNEGCRPRPIYKTMQSPGLLLEGTTTFYENGKKLTTDKIETLAINKNPLDQALFEIPSGFAEVDSRTELMQARRGPVDITAVTRISGSDTDDGKAKTVKTIAIDFFSGSSSKLDQQQLRSYISDKLSSTGMAGYMVTSQAELDSGNFINVIAVDIKKTKESGGAKIGGLFGKVTGTPDAAKMGDSEAEIVITLLAQDRKTVVGSGSASEKVKGSINDAVRAAIDKVLPGLLSKLK